MTEGSWLRDKAAFVGFGHTRYGKRGELGSSGPVPLVMEAVIKACDDAGISPTDLDGFCSYSNDAVDPATLAGSLGIKQLRLTGMGWGGGGGAMAGTFMHACMAVATGQANYVVVHKVMTMEGDNRYGQAFGQIGMKSPVIGGPMAFAVSDPDGYKITVANVGAN